MKKSASFATAAAAAALILLASGCAAITDCP